MATNVVYDGDQLCSAVFMWHGRLVDGVTRCTCAQLCHQVQMLVCLISPIETANIQTARHYLVCGNFSFYADSKALLYGAIFVCPLFKHLDSSSTGTIVVEQHINKGDGSCHYASL